MTLTPAEQLVDHVLAAQRAKGRAKYGKGLDHRDAYDWQSEALQELADAVQYLAAENLRLREERESPQWPHDPAKRMWEYSTSLLRKADSLPPGDDRRTATEIARLLRDGAEAVALFDDARTVDAFGVTCAHTGPHVYVATAHGRADADGPLRVQAGSHGRARRMLALRLIRTGLDILGVAK